MDISSIAATILFPIFYMAQWCSGHGIGPMIVLKIGKVIGVITDNC